MRIETCVGARGRHRTTAEPSRESRSMSHDLQGPEDGLFRRVAQIIDAARAQVARSVNTAMVHAYWLIGREIVEVEQKGEKRADYGKQIVRTLASRLTKQYGRGFSYPSVKRMKQFYLTFPSGSAIAGTADEKSSTVLSLLGAGEKGSTVLSFSESALPAPFPALLSWSHYLVLLRVQNDQARAFYEIEAAENHWSVRELERQIASLLYERLARSRDKEQVRRLADRGQKVTQPTDVIKDPFVLEFLGLKERTSWRESDLEQAIIDRLESFLLDPAKAFVSSRARSASPWRGTISISIWTSIIACSGALSLSILNSASSPTKTSDKCRCT